MSKSYPEAYDDEWFVLAKKGFKLQCCDCGLVHVVNSKVKKRDIVVQFTRDNRATAQVRRHNGIKVKRKKD